MNLCSVADLTATWNALNSRSHLDDHDPDSSLDESDGPDNAEASDMD